MGWTTGEQRVQRRRLVRKRARARAVPEGEVAAWVSDLAERVEEAEARRFVRWRREARDGVPGYRIGGRWYRGSERDVIAGECEAGLLIRRDYGDTDGDGIWRNVILYDLRDPLPGWRRYDLAWQRLQRRWRRCAGAQRAAVWAEELLEWAAMAVEIAPETLSERITAAEAAVGRMTQGGEVSAALVRAVAFRGKRRKAVLPRGRTAMEVSDDDEESSEPG